MKLLFALWVTVTVFIGIWGKKGKASAELGAVGNALAIGVAGAMLTGLIAGLYLLWAWAFS